MSILTVLRDGVRTEIPFDGTPILADVLVGHGFSVPRPCGGHGRCGKCLVAVVSGQVSPQSTRLACQVTLLGDAFVALPDARSLCQIETDGANAVLAAPMPGRFGAAIDIGTTTLALRLYDLTTGELLDSASDRNPQADIAADVMGRIGAALQGQNELLQRLVCDAVEALLPAKADVLTITGNTTMLYLLTGRNPEALSHAPFQADCLFGHAEEVLRRRAYLPRCMSAFVGADITCAVLASGMCNSPKTALLCDIGTNGELALWTDNTLYVTSTAAGPAFEGAGITCGCASVEGAIDRVTIVNGTLRAHTIGEQPPVGVCGSGLLDAVAAGLLLGAIDETGALSEDTFPLTENIALRRQDIRAVQLAKAAIAAGIATLLEYAHVAVDDVSSLFIAGGFGNHLSVASAAAIGLIPPALSGRTRCIGNAALAGAAQILLDQSKIAECGALAERAVSVQLGGNAKFQERFIEYLCFDTEDDEL